MKNKSLINSISLTLVAAGLAACGGGGSSSPDAATSSGISSVGTITGFGSIYVNGIEFETGTASYRVDDEDRFDDSALAVGMKVRIRGTVNDDGTSGTATQVFYDDDVEGPVDTGSLASVDATTKTFTVLGLPVTADATGTVYDDGASFDTLAEGQVLEISGYYDGSSIMASRIEKQSDLDDEFEIKGTVTAYDGTSITIDLLNGSSAGPFAISASAELDIPADPVGEFVEIKLLDQGAGLLATRIESDDDDLLDDSDAEVSIKGVLADDGNGGLLVNGIAFSVNSGTEYEPASLAGNLSPGDAVEIEGLMQNGVLLAREIKTEDGDIEIRARVIGLSASDAKNGTVTLDMGNGQSLAVHTDNSTQFEDDSSGDSNGDESFNLDELAIDSDYLEVRAWLDDGGRLVATEVEREDNGADTILKAPVDASTGGLSVTLLGISYTVQAGTQYEINDVARDENSFFDALNVNDVVKVKDVQPDGGAEELDLED
jgi:hypothetical protein